MNPPPALADILSNTAPPPYTMGAFMAFLSQNHCLETLEFTMDADRYRTSYTEILEQGDPRWLRDGPEHVCSLWMKLMQAYILPCGPREVNLPAHVRDRLLSYPASPMPPHPSELDEAVGIVFELMNDSLLVPFLESMSISYPEAPEEESSPPGSRQGRSRLRIPKDASASSTNEESSRSPKTSFLPLLHIGRSNETASRSPSNPEYHTEREFSYSDDTGSVGTPPGNEPMTPPTTPPTSDWTFGASPGTLHRAISAHNNSWKKMGAKLGLGRKARSKRSTVGVTSAVADPDTYMSDGTHSPY
ncbi:regulator of G protein signaling superfamily [Thozetella sp. PMI_491]|nr:regulator of G protein signaling superfamily [Thozetella sp. PMI_491]